MPYESKRIKCPFASPENCPIYNMSMIELSRAGFTQKQVDEDKYLEYLKKWEESDNWYEFLALKPTIIMPRLIRNFCLEILGEFCAVFDNNIDITKYTHYNEISHPVDIERIESLDIDSIMRIIKADIAESFCDQNTNRVKIELIEKEFSKCNFFTLVKLEKSDFDITTHTEDDVLRELYRKRLQKFNGNMSETAKSLGIKYRTFQSRIKKNYNDILSSHIAEKDAKEKI